MANSTPELGDAIYNVIVTVDNLSGTPIGELSVRVTHRGSLDVTAFAKDVKVEEKDFELLKFNGSNKKGTTITARADGLSASEDYKLQSNDTILVKVHKGNIEIKRQSA